MACPSWHAVVILEQYLQCARKQSDLQLRWQYMQLAKGAYREMGVGAGKMLLKLALGWPISHKAEPRV